MRPPFECSMLNSGPPGCESAPDVAGRHVEEPGRPGLADRDVDRAQPGAVHPRERLQVGTDIDDGDVHLRSDLGGFLLGGCHRGFSLLEVDVRHCPRPFRCLTVRTIAMAAYQSRGGRATVDPAPRSIIRRRLAGTVRRGPGRRRSDQPTTGWTTIGRDDGGPVGRRRRRVDSRSSASGWTDRREAGMPTLRDGTEPIIAHGSVYLRPAERSDIPLFVTWFNDYGMSRNISIRAPMSMAAEEQWFERAVANQGKDGYHFVACLIADDRPIGTVGLFELDLVNGSAGLGISIGAAVRPRQGSRHRHAQGAASRSASTACGSSGSSSTSTTSTPTPTGCTSGSGSSTRASPGTGSSARGATSTCSRCRCWPPSTGRRYGART